MQDGKAKSLFTANELQMILLLVEEGLSQKEIAQECGVSRTTLRQRCHRIFGKVHDFLGYQQPIGMMDLVLFAVTHELVDMRTVIDRYSPVPLTSQAVSA